MRIVRSPVRACRRRGPGARSGPLQGGRYDAFLLGDALAARLTKGDDSALAGYSSACLRRVWDHQEFSQWPSEPFHGTAAGDPLRAGTTLARLRRLCASPGAAAFAEQYPGTAARY